MLDLSGKLVGFTLQFVKAFGKWGLSYRGSKFEAAYTLEDPSLDHGNFLEMIKLLSMYDPCLQQHLTECTEKSDKQHEAGARGRGSLVTLLSKDTINKVVKVISQLIKETIASEVRSEKLKGFLSRLTTLKTSHPKTSAL